MSEHDNVYLVGPMGSGKTTLGRRIAERFGLEFVDCDQEIEQRTGASVDLIFEIEGEAGFRKRESDMLRQLSERTGLLIATGGGVVLDHENRRLMEKTGLVIYLRTPVSQQLLRLARDKSRPLLQRSDRETFLEQLAAQRNPLYREVADAVFESKHSDIRRVTDELASLVKQHWHPEPEDHLHANR